MRTLLVMVGLLVAHDVGAKPLPRGMKVTVDLGHVQGKLSKESFVARAPKELIEKERANEKAFQDKLAQLQTALKKLG